MKHWWTDNAPLIVPWTIEHELQAVVISVPFLFKTVTRVLLKFRFAFPQLRPIELLEVFFRGSPKRKGDSHAKEHRTHDCKHGKSEQLKCSIVSVVRESIWEHVGDVVLVDSVGGIGGNGV
jgi:hypothetical protein